MNKKMALKGHVGVFIVTANRTATTHSHFTFTLKTILFP